MLTRRGANTEALGELREERGANATGIRERLLGAVGARKGGWIVAGLAFALTLPALALGFLSDDRLLRAIGQVSTDPNSLFRLTNPQAAYLRSVGELAWWSSPQLSIQFLRPVTTLTHLAEFHLWPDAAWAMHLANGVLYAVLTGLAWLLYREFLPSDSRCAAVAALLFAINEGNAPAVGWIAGRNTVLANVFGFAAILLHARSRRLASSTRGSGALAQQLRLHWAAALCFALGLLSAEAGIGTFAYLIAYALVFESGTLAKRLITLAPELVLFACWVVVYLAGGFGARGTSFYRDTAQPWNVLAQGILDLPTWLFGLLGPSIVGGFLVFPPGAVRLAALVLVVPLIAGIALALPRTRENVFFALGALLSLPPLFTTQPQDRLLMSASFGAFGVIASFLAAAVRASRFARGTRVVLIGCHFVLAPLLFIPTLGQTRPFDLGSRAIAAQVRAHPAPEVVVVNLPIELMTMYAPAILDAGHASSRPKSIHQLYAGTSPLEVTRLDANTLEVYASRGWGAKTLERVFCAETDLPPAGRKLALDGMAVGVLENDVAGHPVRVQFKFKDALESPSRLWLSWQGRQPALWTPPAIGQTITLEPLDPFKSTEM